MQRRPQPVPAHAGVPAAARGRGRQDRRRCTAAATTPHTKSPSPPAPRRPSSPPSWPSCTGRRGHRARPLLRQLRAQHRAGRGQGRARAAHARHLPPRLCQASARPSRPRTRAILINSPHNPSATVWTARKCAAPSKRLLAPTDVLLISDEVYEHMVYARRRAPERRALSLGLAARAFIVSQLWQDLPRHRLEGRHRGGPRQH